MRVLSWNLYHGRDLPPDPALFTLRSRLFRHTERNATHVQVNRPLLTEFTQVLDGLEWDVALLQEAPPRWFAELCRRTRSSGVLVRTSRNLPGALETAQWALANLNPDLIASSEGGSNQILVRHPGRVIDHRRLTLARRPEQRRMQWAWLELAEGRVCAANLHASAGLPERASAELVRAAERAVEWSGGQPLVFGGDLNLRPARDPEPFETLRDRFGLAEFTARDAIDHLLVRGLEVVERPRRLAPERRELVESGGLRLRLSDHAPVAAVFRLPR
ncbi:MAG TPA: endonuclease/exonuclease/phosphatase family protein [Thermoleophilaceae bacterium]|jgi:endonuclease/exonuclease/phosphatase family metal-dependent hydrolase|nr:endonuclease/exonuclease/phosphatase family protein [Thermoleophilaceae bacterium]